ncbi:uncharacterized protein LAESUDRAFT_762126 [Laetiporus sulphureus 93-53]|uniref:Uncharacterized protein n=1 Tax=Laetiporus sulphureus 93-53 TaxID=1314785 RepID=A0A165CNI6_9APHY|nr:uncharacterized protein LAESUDRAFT_762126 [Laetiporus sulphureus 93-53]KZT03133.1 hypothetical protein LAESUDRAFT_762126 [Laetiporus sulphureus 93-53]
MTETKVTTALKDLRVGDMIWVKATVNKADLANPAATSATTKAVLQGKHVKRLCVVLIEGTTSVVVTYLTTFGDSAALPTRFTDKSYWYPAQWVSLRQKQTIFDDPVPKVASRFTSSSIRLILNAMKE